MAVSINRCYPELGKYGFFPANPGVKTNFYCYIASRCTAKHNSEPLICAIAWHCNCKSLFVPRENPKLSQFRSISIWKVTIPPNLKPYKMASAMFKWTQDGSLDLWPMTSKWVWAIQVHMCLQWCETGRTSMLLSRLVLWQKCIPKKKKTKENNKTRQYVCTSREKDKTFYNAKLKLTI